MRSRVDIAVSSCGLVIHRGDAKVSLRLRRRVLLLGDLVVIEALDSRGG